MGHCSSTGADFMHGGDFVMQTSSTFTPPYSHRTRLWYKFTNPETVP